MTSFLIDNPFILLFAVAGIGFLIGQISVGGFRLGVSAVLFVGLAAGALDPEMRLPDFVYQVGLLIFVYTVGLASGRGFVYSLRRKGLRDSTLVLGVIVVASGLVLAVQRIADLTAGLAAGMFAGSLTNTPALAAILEYQAQNADPSMLDTALAEPVVGYSLAYPVGVLGMIIAIYVAQRIWHIDYRKEARKVGDPLTVAEDLVDIPVLITSADVDGASVDEVMDRYGWRVLFARRLGEGHVELVTGATRLHRDDVVTVVGPEEEVEKAIASLGERSDVELALDRSVLDFRRIFVSSPATVGRHISDLQLPRTFGAIATRVRRGDLDLLATGDLLLEPGDRIRVVAPPAKMHDVTEFFGDSYKALSEVDVAVFSLGIVAGLLIGLIPIPLPGGGSFELGLAGGPLLVGLLAGALGRTGPIRWQIPYAANLTLRQAGIILFLAGIGTRSGWSFRSTLGQDSSLYVFLGGVVITMTAAVLMLFIGHRLLKIPFGMLTGMLAGLQTQPAVLAFATEQAGDEVPNAGYAAVIPVAMVAKIVIAQVLIASLG